MTTRFVGGIRIAHQQTGIFGQIVDAKHCIEVTQTIELSESDRPHPNSYSVIEDDVSVPVHLDDVLKFVTGNNTNGSFQRSSKFQRQTHTALTDKTEVIVLTQIGTQIEGIQRIAAVEILATYKVMFTRAYLYRIHVCNTGTQYMLHLCLHVRTGIAYMYAHALSLSKEAWRTMMLYRPTNLHPISHRFEVIADYWSNLHFRQRGTPL